MIYYVTFYSYKGGVGRTLALVNTAFALTARGKRVLIWDLDLEAPSMLQIPEFASLRQKVTGGTVDILASPQADLNKQVAGLIVGAAPGLLLLPAGADDEKYPERYAAVPLDKLFGGESTDGSRLFEQMRQAIEQLPDKRRPDVVLIDSRTGLTDLGAICTVQLPHTVVLVYTLNDQGAFGARRALAQILNASKKLRYQDQQVKTRLVAGFVPTEDRKLLEERRAQLREQGLQPDFEIPFRPALLLRDEVYTAGALDPEFSAVFERLADDLLRLAPDSKAEPVDLRVEVHDDMRAKKGRTFEDKVAIVLRLMDLEVTENTLASGRQTDIVARGKAGLREITYVVECKDHEKPRGVADLDSLNARVLAFQNREPKSGAHGLLVSRRGFTPEAKAHAEDLQTVLLKTYDELLDDLVNLGPYNATLINDVSGQPIERLYVEQNVYPEEKPAPVALSEHVERWMEDPNSTFLTLLGDYGTGKTWFTRMLAFRLAERYRDDPSRRRQPVRIDLRTVAKAFDLEAILFSHFQAITGRALNPKAFLHLLEEGRFLLIFDGFDEMATQGDWGVTLENFRQLTRAAAGRAKVLLTCRTHYFRDQSYVQELIAGRRPELTEGGTELYKEISGRQGYRLGYLPGFTEDQTHEYIDRACGERAGEVHDILAREPRLKEIASRPILLEIIVKSAPKLARLGRDINTANLYEAYTEHWFDREDWRLRITRENRRELVEALARHLWREPNARLHYSALRGVIEPLLRDRAFTVRDLEDADREIRTAAFLTRDGEGNYGFSHRSFLEFFLASWIRRRLEAGDYVAALQHPLLTPPVLQFLKELAAPAQLQQGVRSILETSYTAQASENALLLSKGGARKAQLQGTRLGKFRLPGVDLSGADLTLADLSEADLAEAQLTNAVLRETNLERTRLWGVKASGADFTGANLQGVDLEGAELRSADFSLADLSFANLLGADTEGATWTGAGRFGVAGPRRPALPVRAVGALGRLWSRQIAIHPRLPLIAVADEGGVSIIDSVAGALRHHLPHPGTRSVAWDPAGERLASAADDGALRVWRAADGQLLRTLEGHQGQVFSVAWDPAGERLASGAQDRTLRVWRAADGQLLRTLKGHKRGVRSVAWDPAGERLASAADDNTLRVWRAADGQLLHTLEGHADWVLSVAWDPAGERLASGAQDRTLRVWRAADGQLLRTLESREAVGCVAWNPSGGQLAFAIGSDGLRVWDPEKTESLRTLEGHTDWVMSVAWDPAGERLASGAEDSTLRVWRAADGQLLRTLEGHQGLVRSVAWDPAGERLASAAADSTLRVWRAADGQLLRTLEGHQGLVRSVAWDPAGERLASAAQDRTLRVWRAADGQLLRTLEGHTDWVWSVAWDLAGERLASGSADCSVRLWDPAQGTLLCTLKGHTDWVMSVAWDPAGERLASAAADSTVRVWRAADGQLLRTLEGHQGLVRSVAWGPAGKRLASGADDGTLRVWRAADGQLLRTLEGHQGLVRSVAWDPAGERLASAAADSTLRVWRATDGQLLRALEGHQGPVRSVAWDPAGERLASAAEDNTIRIWDAQTGQCLWTIHLLPEGGWLAIGPDDKFHANEAGKRHFMFADGWALYPARAFPELEL